MYIPTLDPIRFRANGRRFTPNDISRVRRSPNDYRRDGFRTVPSRRRGHKREIVRPPPPPSTRISRSRSWLLSIRPLENIHSFSSAGKQYGQYTSFLRTYVRIQMYAPQWRRIRKYGFRPLPRLRVRIFHFVSKPLLCTDIGVSDSINENRPRTYTRTLES